MLYGLDPIRGRVAFKGVDCRMPKFSPTLPSREDFWGLYVNTPLTLLDAFSGEGPLLGRPKEKTGEGEWLLSWDAQNQTISSRCGLGLSQFVSRRPTTKAIFYFGD